MYTLHARIKTVVILSWVRKRQSLIGNRLAFYFRNSCKGARWDSSKGYTRTKVHESCEDAYKTQRGVCWTSRDKGIFCTSPFKRQHTHTAPILWTKPSGTVKVSTFRERYRNRSAMCTLHTRTGTQTDHTLTTTVVWPCRTTQVLRRRPYNSWLPRRRDPRWYLL